MKKSLILILIQIFLLTPSLGLFAATDTYHPLSPLPCIPSPGSSIECRNGDYQLETTVDIKGYVQKTFNLFIALATVAAVFMIVLGGFEYMTSDAFQKKSDGLNKIKNALWGLLLVLTSFLILRTIDPRLVQINENLVDPLSLNIKPVLSGIFDNLEATLRENNADIREAIKNRAELEAQMMDVESRIAELENDPMSDPSGVRKMGLEAEKLRLQDAINEAKAKEILVNFNAITTQQFYTGTNENHDLKTSLEEIKKNYELNKERLTELGAQQLDGSVSTALQDLEITKKYADATVTLLDICKEATSYGIAEGAQDVISGATLYLVPSSGLSATKKRDSRIDKEVLPIFNSMPPSEQKTKLYKSLTSIQSEGCTSLKNNQ